MFVFPDPNVHPTFQKSSFKIVFWVGRKGLKDDFSFQKIVFWVGRKGFRFGHSFGKIVFCVGRRILSKCFYFPDPNVHRTFQKIVFKKSSFG